MKAGYILGGLVALSIVMVAFKIGMDFQTLRSETWAIHANTAILQKLDGIDSSDDAGMKRCRNTVLVLLNGNVRYIESSYLQGIFPWGSRDRQQIEIAKGMLRRSAEKREQEGPK